MHELPKQCSILKNSYLLPAILWLLTLWVILKVKNNELSKNILNSNGITLWILFQILVNKEENNQVKQSREVPKKDIHIHRRYEQ